MSSEIFMKLFEKFYFCILSFLDYSPYNMFDSPDFPKSLDETLFNIWLENGRSSKISYSHLLVVWDEFDSAYQPVYVESGEEIDTFQKYGTLTVRESLIAAYDLYSESRVV